MDTYSFDEQGVRRIVATVRDYEGETFTSRGAGRGRVVVGRSQTVAVLATGLRAANGFYPGRFVGVPQTTTTLPPLGSTTTSSSTTTTANTCNRWDYITEETQDCWLATEDEVSPGLSVFSALVAGTAADGLPICLHSDLACEQTTTTPAPCMGSCTWSFLDNVWNQTGSTCDAGCTCVPPLYCPGTIPECGVQTTYCSRDSFIQPDCTGATTTTVAPGECVGTSCTFKKIFADMLLIADDCTPHGCGCTRPDPTFSADCAEVVVFCSPLQTTTTTTGVPISPCGCFCDWHWYPTAGGWRSGSCTCNCPRPSVDGTVCGEVVYTKCSPCSSPGGCDGFCSWQGNGAGGWDYVETTCVECGCGAPTRASVDACDVETTKCFSVTTTTSTTTTTAEPTTTTSTTTTTANPCTGGCSYRCVSGVWVPYNCFCTEGCGCGDAPDLEPCAGEGNVLTLNRCSGGLDCVVPTTTTTSTTTTTTTTSTTTTTTAAPEPCDNCSPGPTAATYSFTGTTFTGAGAWLNATIVMTQTIINPCVYTYTDPGSGSYVTWHIASGAPLVMRDSGDIPLASYYGGGFCVGGSPSQVFSTVDGDATLVVSPG